MHYNYHYYLKNPIVIVFFKKKTTNPQPALSSFCAVTQKICVLKARVCFYTPMPHPSTSQPQCYVQVKELLYLISLFLVHGKEADQNRKRWPKRGSGCRRMRARGRGSEHCWHKEERTEASGSLDLKAHTSMDGERLSLLLGFVMRSQ